MFTRTLFECEAINSAARLVRTLVPVMIVGLAWVGPAHGADTTAQPLSQTTPLSAPAPVMFGASSLNVPSWADIVQRVSPGVVSLTTSKGLGSGFVIDSSGYVVTNNHVVATSTEAEVRFADGSKFKARLIGRDEATDIALLKIDAPKAFPSVKFDDDRKVRVGDWVLAVGNPFGLGGTVTAGILSARGRDEVGSGQFTDYLQVDAAINPGNSGGPTFDTNGRVIGMNSMGLSNRTGETAGGIGFAIPSTTIQRVVEDLKTSGSVSRGFIGVQIESLTEDAAKALGLPNANGALVTDVIEGGPAQLAGIKRGDVILKINGQSVKDNRELSRKIAALVVGQSAVFTIWRETKQIAISVTAIKRERIADAGDILNRAENPEVRLTSLGLGLRTITPQIRDIIAPRGGNVAGVVITDLDLSSDAAQRGLRPGDRIVAVGGADVSSMGDVNLAVEQAKSLKRPMVLLFVVTQAGAKTHVAVKFNTP